MLTSRSCLETDSDHLNRIGCCIDKDSFPPRSGLLERIFVQPDFHQFVAHLSHPANDGWPRRKWSQWFPILSISWSTQMAKKKRWKLDPEKNPETSCNFFMFIFFVFSMKMINDDSNFTSVLKHFSLNFLKNTSGDAFCFYAVWEHFPRFSGFTICNPARSRKVKMT